MPPYLYLESHYKDKMVLWQFYLYRGCNPYTQVDDIYIETGPGSYKTCCLTALVVLVVPSGYLCWFSAVWLVVFLCGIWDDPRGFYNHSQCYPSLILLNSGPWFNIKMPSYQYRKSHCGDKTVVRSSYLHNGISYAGKMSSLYWIRALISSLSS